jgi:hypothetical protein
VPVDAVTREYIRKTVVDAFKLWTPHEPGKE